MESKEVTKARYHFQKALYKLVEKYKSKGVKMSVDIKWDADAPHIQSEQGVKK